MQNVNIKLLQDDLHKIKALATDKGISYQVLISSLLHKYSTEKIRDKV